MSGGDKFIFRQLSPSCNCQFTKMMSHVLRETYVRPAHIAPHPVEIACRITWVNLIKQRLLIRDY